MALRSGRPDIVTTRGAQHRAARAAFGTALEALSLEALTVIGVTVR